MSDLFCCTLTLVIFLGWSAEPKYSVARISEHNGAEECFSAADNIRVHSPRLPRPSQWVGAHSHFTFGKAGEGDLFCMTTKLDYELIKAWRSYQR